MLSKNCNFFFSTFEKKNITIIAHNIIDGAPNTIPSTSNKEDKNNEAIMTTQSVIRTIAETARDITRFLSMCLCSILYFM